VRRILAGLAAIAMLAAGFLVRRSLDDPERGKAPLTIACVPEALAACNAIARVRVTVTELSPADIEKALRNAAGAAPFDAVVTVSPWPERLKGSTAAVTPRSDVGLVASPVMVARRSAANDTCRAKLSCLVALDGRVAFPDIRSSTTGAIIAAATMKGGSVDAGEIEAETPEAEKLVGQLREATTRQFPLGAIGTLTSAGALLDAAVDVSASIPQDVPGLVLTPAVPATTVQLRLLGFVDDERLATAEAGLRKTLQQAGWSASTTSGVPDVGLMSATYARLA
jgi:hypothetical protein